MEQGTVGSLIIFILYFLVTTKKKIIITIIVYDVYNDIFQSYVSANKSIVRTQ